MTTLGTHPDPLPSAAERPAATQERVAVVGLGYVGLPLALALGRAFPGTIGFDISERRVRDLAAGTDGSGDVAPVALRDVEVRYTTDPQDLAEATAIIVAVPTPIDANHQPDLTPLERACRSLGPHLRKGAVVVFESTVYPGVTEEFCGPLLAQTSGLQQGVDFKLGYSPERINPGDTEHTLETITKVISAEDEPTLERVATIYGAVIEAGLYRAPSIRIAEAAKVIENTQRDLNIALVNELAIIFDRLGLPTREVLAAARTKWNFLPFTPGLVGGHCIGVDPYYLTAKAEQVGYHPEVILAGRRINDGMGAFVAQKLVKLLAHVDHVPLKQARVAVLGLTFKENVADLRNSRVPDIVAELAEYGIEAQVHDPVVDPSLARSAYGLELVGWDDLKELDALVLAVPHRAYLETPLDALLAPLRKNGIIIDIKSTLDPTSLPADLTYWSL